VADGPQGLGKPHRLRPAPSRLVPPKSTVPLQRRLVECDAGRWLFATAFISGVARPLQTSATVRRPGARSDVIFLRRRKHLRQRLAKWSGPGHGRCQRGVNLFTLLCETLPRASQPAHHPCRRRAERPDQPAGARPSRSRRARRMGADNRWLGTATGARSRNSPGVSAGPSGFGRRLPTRRLDVGPGRVSGPRRRSATAGRAGGAGSTPPGGRRRSGMISRNSPFLADSCTARTAWAPLTLLAAAFRRSLAASPGQAWSGLPHAPVLLRLG